MFHYKGVCYHCVPNTLHSGEQLDIGGKQGQVTFTLIVLQCDFPFSLTADMTTVSADSTGFTADEDYDPPPRSGDRVTYGLLRSGMSQRYARGIAAKYKVGSDVTVYHNPKNHGDSLLNPHARWHYFPWLVAACIFALVWAIATGKVG